MSTNGPILSPTYLMLVTNERGERVRTVPIPAEFLAAANALGAGGHPHHSPDQALSSWALSQIVATFGDDPNVDIVT